MSGGRRPPPLPAESQTGGQRRQQQAAGAGDSSRLRANDPSSSRPRSVDVLWPEHFVEAVAVRVAENAATFDGRLAAAPAVVAFFQVCSAWRTISWSELLWEELTHRVWSPRRRRRRLHPSWRQEFISLHRIAANFRSGRCLHSQPVHPPPSPARSCRRLALSDRKLAAGFTDGHVHLYDLPSAAFLGSYDLHLQRDRLGRFSRSISGIILRLRRLIFASQDGDIGVAPISSAENGNVTARRARAGNPVEDGTLVDFTGDERWWVGLFAGVPGRSWRVWDGETEEEVFAGGSLTDLESVAGWHMLADISGPSVARIGVAEEGLVVGCTGTRLQAVRVEERGAVGEGLDMELRAAAVDGMGASEGRVVVVEGGWLGVVRVAQTMEEVCRFGLATGRRRGDEGRVLGCMNWGYVVVWVGGGVGRIWDAANGELLYGFRERVGETVATAASDRYVAAWAEDSGLHLWDFGAGL
ncbi:hypothetical protein HPP92_014030 [Vanilla planifolia]|uniref:Uncharacterized protein n=1 Tax=Vanilla planifolia TaxID=51239 RepID=A0A835UVB7_VANPL|nr:hypothetical protein HPP92_014030 [Vanilla planifolia]